MGMEEMKSIKVPKVIADVYMNSDEILYHINNITGECIGYLSYDIGSEIVFRILFKSVIDDDSITRITKIFIISDEIGIDKYVISLPKSTKEGFFKLNMEFINNSRKILSSDSEGEIISKLLHGFDEDYVINNWEKISVEEVNSPSELFRIEKV